MLTSYYVIPLILLLIGLVLFLPPWTPKVVWIGKVLTGIALIALAVMFLGSHTPHLFGRL